MPDTETLTFARRLPAPPARVYAALTDPSMRAIWNVPDATSALVMESDALPAPGLRETAQIGPVGAPEVTVLTDWVLMEPGTRLVFAETLMAGDMALGSALASADLTAEGGQTHLALTVLAISYEGAEVLAEMRGGWAHAVDALAQYLDLA